MSEAKKIDVKSLYSVLLRETKNETIQEINSDLYANISNFVGNLKSEGYDGVEGKVKDQMVNLITDMVSLLVNIRLDKAIVDTTSGNSNLLDEEKFILDVNEEIKERKEMILSATLNGKSKLLESVTKNHKTKGIVVRFLQEMDQVVGSDLKKYGPYKAEDVASIPYENAQALISKKIATKIRWQD